MPMQDRRAYARDPNYVIPKGQWILVHGVAVELANDAPCWVPDGGIDVIERADQLPNARMDTCGGCPELITPLLPPPRSSED